MVIYTSGSIIEMNTITSQFVIGLFLKTAIDDISLFFVN
ncbi:hypothetical protein EC2747800_2970 [Escherichia coli 2747800]|nr:hypothetical protein EC2860050_2979 [Escherichia coli 2860050]EMW73957.1 hypothetical protein EC2747800_2970 [Escherichia coli 2747800]KEM11060.1 hypothetical protein AD20_0836 [Escherichia coli 6-175-07_S4_C2]